MDTEDPATPSLEGADKAGHLAELREIANLTENKLAVWQALALHLGGRSAYEAYDPATVSNGQMVQIPAWCAQYLLQSAINLQEITNQHFHHQLSRGNGVNAEAALELVPRALGLSGSGWSAFRRAISTWESLQDWRMYRDATAGGSSSAEAMERVRVFRNLGDGPNDLRSAARRVSKGRKLAEQLTKARP